jgi:hypothetical protein
MGKKWKVKNDTNRKYKERELSQETNSLGGSIRDREQISE